ncbi:MAG: cohesin domain-containing protein [Candidatus Shapirobacteria bacterium]
MKDKKDKTTSSMGLIVIALSVFIIAESIWLVGKLEEIGQNTGSSSRGTPAGELSKVNQEGALFTLAGPDQVGQGELFTVTALLTTQEDVLTHGLDVVLNYDPKMLEVIGLAKLDSDSPLGTIGLNVAEEDKERVLVSLLEVDNLEGVILAFGQEYKLFSLQLRAIASGKTAINLETDQEKARKTQILDAKLDRSLPLDKEDLEVIIL